LVATVTATTGSQRTGMAAILLFLIAGLLMMLPVREPGGQPVNAGSGACP
jgi:MFS-type transporter involved in bile tolerance (Atg22 family)